jgi:hypothetical protein
MMMANKYGHGVRRSFVVSFVSVFVFVFVSVSVPELLAM